MFDGPNYPKALDEDTFESWLDRGRASVIPYAYLMVIWDELDNQYLPIYVENRADFKQYAKYGQAPDHQLLVAAYDLYSETRVI